ncbi:3-oxoadipate enol-lactonase [Aureimonas populi]|uniref:3-oxoadipate enol-lactonase n=1 Tax=Aureimonas populi TaxID=1701758 RepID=A0ABW5CIY2_9HYPH|nr:3-oxoadipate enol-lactonase [Aureimonas populi]
MSFKRVGRVVLHYKRVGSGPRVVLLNSLGSDLRIWDEVVERLSGEFEILAYDKRGHGLSDAPPAPYTIADHAGDLTGLLDALDWPHAALVGLSVGGLIAQEIVARAPERVSSLVLCGTAARIGTAEMWAERIAAVEGQGFPPISRSVIGRWFTQGFAAQRPDEWAGWLNMLERTPGEGYAGTCAAIRDADLTAEAGRIAIPTLAIVGDEDMSTPPDLVRATAALIPGCRFETIAGAAHLPCIEKPAETAALIASHFRKDA